jgi:hypothetical protein
VVDVIFLWAQAAAQALVAHCKDLPPLELCSSLTPEDSGASGEAEGIKFLGLCRAAAARAGAGRCSAVLRSITAKGKAGGGGSRADDCRP